MMDILKDITPLHWQVQKDQAGEFGIWSPSTVDTFAESVVEAVEGDNPDANAAYIVHAANNYPALVEALEGLLSGLGPDGYVLPAGAIKTKRARAALAKAGEQS